MRPLLVGEDNPHSDNPRAALFPRPRGAAGHRLAEILGMSGAEYLRAFARTNLCDGPWVRAAADLRAEQIQFVWPGPIVLLGAKVARAFGVPYAPFSTRRSADGSTRVLVLPHPSGRCRVWNDPAARTRARRAVRRLLRLSAD